MNKPEVKRVAISAQALKEKVLAIGQQITRDYAGKELVLVGVLKGSLYFLADLTRAVDLPLSVDLIAIGVYPGATSQTGVVRITKDLDIDVSGKHVLIIEDIVRTGLTTGYLVQNIQARNPESVNVCTLLINPAQRLIEFPIAYTGFTVDTQWLMGYGMDIGEKWRNLPYIAEVDKK